MSFLRQLLKNVVQKKAVPKSFELIKQKGFGSALTSFTAVALTYCRQI